MIDLEKAKLDAVARCLAIIDDKFISAHEWHSELQAVYQERAKKVLRTIQNVEAGVLSGG